MKGLLAVVVLCALYAQAYCQSSTLGSTETKSAIDSLTKSSDIQNLREEIKKELSHYKNGDDLYRRSDLFQRMIMRRVEQRLGMLEDKPIADEPLDVTSDTSISSDISRTANDENEASIAINRVNPKLLATGANDYEMYSLSMPAYISTDAGASWTTHRLPAIDDHGCVAGGDPVLVCDNAGNFYYAFLIFTTNATGVFLSDVMVARSTNGTDWTLAKPLMGNTIPDFSLEDKETMAVDRDSTSPYYGRIYVVWTHYANVTAGNVSYQLISHSDDHGVTWSTPKQFTTHFGYFALLRVGKGGAVFYASSAYGGSNHGIMVSHDGGDTFDEHPVASYTDYPFNNNSVNGLKGPNGFRAFPYMSFDVNPSDNTLYAAYGSYERNKYATLYAVNSTDEGRTWSAPSPIGTPGLLSTDHFMPWVSFDPVKKQAYVSFYSSEEDTAGNVKSRTVRCNFETVNQIEDLSNELFDPTAVRNVSNYNFIGDYISSDACNGYFAVAWTENRPNAQDGEILGYVSSPYPIVTQTVQQINASEFEVSDPMPNPVVSNIVVWNISSSDAKSITISLFDQRGVKALSTEAFLNPGGDGTSIQLDLHQLSAGVYRAVISDGRQIIEKNIVVLR